MEIYSYDYVATFRFKTTTLDSQERKRSIDYEYD